MSTTAAVSGTTLVDVAAITAPHTTNSTGHVHIRTTSTTITGGTIRSMPWLPAQFVHPDRVEVATGHHLRPIRASDVELDYPAVMGSRERLWSIFGAAWGWPPADMTYEQDRVDLARHEREIAAHQSFNYALFDAPESALLGCVYIDPPEKAGADAEISWWVIDSLVGGDVERALDLALPAWIAESWPFARPRYLGRDLSWADWMALPTPRDAAR